MTNMDDVARQFSDDVASHQMIPFRDEGLYRHLRFEGYAPARAGGGPPQLTSFYWFDLITWPGSLTITGDMDTFTFSRKRDMFQFFRGSARRGQINPGYWAEQIRRPCDPTIYSEDRFRRLVIEHFIDAVRGHYAPAGLGKAVRAEILASGDTYYEDGARVVLEDFKYDGFRFEDTWEWDLRDYSYQFLWCCHAIAWGIRRYDAQKAAAA